MNYKYHTLRLVLGDQLNDQHSWWNNIEPSTIFVMMEVKSEANYVSHHIQKIALFFSAMRQFFRQQVEKGFPGHYIHLNDPENQPDITLNLHQLIQKWNIKRFEYQKPDEYRLKMALHQFSEDLLRQGVEVQSYTTEHFICEPDEFQTIFQGSKTFLMERFYRKMRSKYHVLMDENQQPLGGQWNYDHDNRESFPKKWDFPKPMLFNHDVSDIVEMLLAEEIKTMGSIEGNQLNYPVNRTEALALMQDFMTRLLPYFGKFQDAMHTDEPFLYHSRLSSAMNLKLIHPLEVVRAAEKAYSESKGAISLSQAEGFIRQILGWREYMRGLYFTLMPDFAEMNFFEHRRPLPNYYWTGKTQMKCMSQAIGQSLEYAYAHHIQRLMVTGNFALLAGIDPAQLDEWYLGIYIDAIEWVELPNTRGMSQYADGGKTGSKPYVSSANYIDKMSNYCNTCYYDKKQKVGSKACPFNSLYWHFYHRHRSLLESNPRIGMMYRTWDKMDAVHRNAILNQAEQHLSHLEKL